MLLPSSKINDGEVYRELEIGQTTKVMKNLREKEGCLELQYIKSRQLEVQRMRQKKEKSRN